MRQDWAAPSGAPGRPVGADACGADFEFEASSSRPGVTQVWMKVQIHQSRLHVFGSDFEGVGVHLVPW